MTKTILETIDHELIRLNEEIDLRIIRGLPYRNLSKRHKLLLKMVNEAASKAPLRFKFMSFLL